jgi:hypothetical protein
VFQVHSHFEAVLLSAGESCRPAAGLQQHNTTQGSLLHCRFARGSTGGFSRMFVMDWTRFLDLEGTVIGEGAMV